MKGIGIAILTIIISIIIITLGLFSYIIFIPLSWIFPTAIYIPLIFIALGVIMFISAVIYIAKSLIT